MRVEAINHDPTAESLQSKEKPQVLLDVLTLTGYAGTGKSATIRSLAPPLDVPKSRIFQAGEMFREMIREDTGQEVLDFAERSVQLDIELDNRMTEFMRNSREVGLTIVEGRLAGWIAKRLVSEAKRQKRKSLHVLSVILGAEEEIRVGRVLKRDIRKNPNLTFEEVWAKTRNRADKDLEQWRKAYPELAEIDPLDPELVDQNGNRVYDLVVDTDHLRVHQVVGTIYNFLLENGKVKDGNSLPPHGTIFDAA